eukprot:29235-Eustigmatos_ZCMA.PRE.1
MVTLSAWEASRRLQPWEQRLKTHHDSGDDRPEVTPQMDTDRVNGMLSYSLIMRFTFGSEQ